jgi:hypothetical protein
MRSVPAEIKERAARTITRPLCATGGGTCATSSRPVLLFCNICFIFFISGRFKQDRHDEQDKEEIDTFVHRFIDSMTK